MTMIHMMSTHGTLQLTAMHPAGVTIGALLRHQAEHLHTEINGAQDMDMPENSEHCNDMHIVCVRTCDSVSFQFSAD